MHHSAAKAQQRRPAARASPAAGGDLPGDDLAAAHAFVEPLTLGINVEREMMWEASVAEIAFLRRQVPFTHVRVFLPWRPQGGLAACIGYNVPPPDRAVRAFVDAIGRYIDAGFVVFADFTDVVEPWNDLKDDNQRRLIERVVGDLAAATAARGYPPTKLSPGPINEWAGEDQHAVCNALRPRLDAAIRRHLPRHVVTHGSHYWKHSLTLAKSEHEPVASLRTIYDIHSYDGRDAEGWIWVRDVIQAWQAGRGRGRPVVYGEWGTGQNGVDDQNFAAYPQHTRLAAPILAPFRPMPWAVTKGGHWKMNRTGMLLAGAEHGLPIREALVGAEAVIRAALA